MFVGVKYVKFWLVVGSELVGKRGIFIDVGIGIKIKILYIMFFVVFGVVSFFYFFRFIVIIVFIIDVLFILVLLILCICY